MEKVVGVKISSQPPTNKCFNFGSSSVLFAKEISSVFEFLLHMGLELYSVPILSRTAFLSMDLNADDASLENLYKYPQFFPTNFTVVVFLNLSQCD